jgi:hypothetical protein
MVNLETLAKLAREATPVWLSSDASEQDQFLSTLSWADAAYIAAASPDVVLALVRVAQAAGNLAVNEADTHPFMERWHALRAALADLDR